MEAQMHIVRDIVYASVARGGDLKKICVDLGIEPADLNNAERMIPYKLAAEVWDVAIAHSGDKLLGLHMGEQLNPSILGMHGYLMQNSRNLGDAFKALSAYNDLYSTMMRFRSAEEGDTTSFLFEPALRWQKEYAESARQSVEIAMAGVLKIFGLLSGSVVRPLRIELTYRGRLKEEYERIFRCPVVFNAKANRMTFQSTALEQTVLSHDRSLFAFFEDILQQKLMLAKQSSTLSDLIRTIIIQEFKGKVPPAEILASRMNVTVRSMQRRLSDEGVTYRALGQLIKHELARAMINSKQYRRGEIAEVLGYSDGSSFRKAYKKWMS